MDTLLGGVWLIAAGYCFACNGIDRAYALYERAIGRHFVDNHTGGAQ